MKRTMVIDGTFMLKRLLREYTFMENPEKDRIGFLTDLSNHISCEIGRVSGFVDNIIVCRDSRSWRKNINIKQKLYINSNNEIEFPNVDGESNYKANRIKSEDRNWTLIYEAFNEFCEILNTHFNVAYIATDGAEGDDAIWAVCKHLRVNKKLSCIYCTDSDLNQLVSPRTVVLRRIKSKASPEGEIIVNKQYWDYYEKSTKQSNDLLELFSTDVTKFVVDDVMFNNKSLGCGIFINYPMYNILKSMLMGSGKDNVPELFSWAAKSTNRHITDKFVNNALILSGIESHDQLTIEHIYNEPFLKTLIINLIHVTKQSPLLNHIDYLYEILISNRKLNFLSEREIPEQLQNDLREIIVAQKHMIADMEKLSDSKNITEALKITGNKIYQNLGL